MSRFYFYYLAPAFIIGAGIFFVSIAPQYRQHLLIDFAVVYYAIVRLSKWHFGASTRLGVITPRALEGKKIPPALQEIALREFEYIRETMAQAMNDRHTLVNYFLLAAGVVIAAIGVVYGEEGMKYSPYKSQITIAISLVFGFVAWIYLLKIVRLRQAWCESCTAMNRIKQFFLVNVGLEDDAPTSPFLWKSSTIPRAAKKGNVFHLAALLISFISALAVGLASVMLLPVNSLRTIFWVSGAFFLYHFFLQASSFTVFLEEKEEKAKSNKESSEGSSAGIKDSTEKANSGTAVTAHASEEHDVRPRRVILHEETTVLDDVFKVKTARLQFEKFDGALSKTVNRLNLERGHSAAILLHDTQNDAFILVEQFRYPAFAHKSGDGWLVEVIAGMVEEGETPKEVAIREAKEETGYEADGVELMSEFYASPGGSSERISVFFGKVAAQVGEGGGCVEESEDIRVVRMPVNEAYERLDQGFFEDAKTVVALLCARERVTSPTAQTPR